MKAKQKQTTTNKETGGPTNNTKETQSKRERTNEKGKRKKEIQQRIKDLSGQ